MTPEADPGAARRVLSGLVLAVALFAAVVVQLTVVNRLPLPGSAAPDLVLLLVIAIAVVTGPIAGAVTGFAGGLMLDVAPPAAHYAGQDALVFCLAGYGAAWAARALWEHSGERDPLTAFTVLAVAAAAGEAGQAGLGLLLSDPDITAASVTRVLPAAIFYDLVLAPFVFVAASWVTGVIRRGRTAPEEVPVPAFNGGSGLAAVFRAASAGAAPGLQLSGSGGDYRRPSSPRRVPRLQLSGSGGDYRRPSSPRRVPRLQLSGSGGDYRRPSSPRRVPRLQLSGSRAPELARTLAAGSRRPFPVAGGRGRRLNFAGDLATGPARAPGRKARAPRKDWLRASGSPAARSAPAASGTRAPSRGWLGPGGKGAPGAGGGRGTAGLTRTRSGATALAARSAPSGVSALSGAGTPRGRRSPHAGWLRGSGAMSSLTRGGGGRRLAPRRGWLGAGGRPRIVIGSGVTGGAAFRRGSIARGNWYTAAPSRDWLRRSRHPWRKRRQRLLRRVGVGR